MPYQYKREPLSDDEVNRLTNACETFDEKLIIWTLLDTGLRVGELAHLKKDNILWQERRILPMTDRIRRLIDHHFAEHDSAGMSSRTIQRIVKEVANKAGISTRALMALLGHDRLATTEIYLNLSPEDAIREFQNKW